jgi:ubiquitin C-terminal hydrolase
MIQYNNKYAFSPFGITNTGNSCYFNSFIQCIMSLTSIFETINDNNITSELESMLKNINEENSLKIHKFLLRNSKGRLTNGAQEDVNEIFMMFIDNINPLVLKLFENRTRHVTKCICGKKYEGSDICTMIEISDKELQGNNLNDFIKKNIEVCENFLCECGNKDNKIKISYISMLPEIIPILFTKYPNKSIINFPMTLEFDKIGGGKLNYKLVAQSEHSGSMNGGHYYAYSQRKDGVYLFNDSSYQPAEFKPMANTYMIFYHII